MMIKTQRLNLRPLSLNDIQDFQTITDDYDVLKMTGTLDFPFTIEMATTKINSFITLDTAFGQAFAITLKQALIGCISIQSMQRDHIFEIGYHVGKTWWGQGYVSEAVMALIPWAFHQWGQELIIEAGHYEDNPASGTVLRKAGFIQKDHKSQVYCTTRKQELSTIDYRLNYKEWMAHKNG